MINRNGKTRGSVDRMARMGAQVGVDMVMAYRTGELTADDLSAAITRCFGCPETEACDIWRAAHPDGADHPPGYCRNAALFDQLRP
jgi:hypothetical protein